MGGGGGGAPPGAGPGDVGLLVAEAGDSALGSSMAESGRGGAMVPNRMDASCLAEPPVGPSDSSSEELSEESTTDQSSVSSERPRVRVPPVVGCGGGSGVEALSCWVRRWKGFVETSALGVGDATDEAAAGMPLSLLA
jgi:hypothetical protein